MSTSSTYNAGGFPGLVDALFRKLEHIFRDAGWSVVRDPPGGPIGYRADFLIERGGLRYVVELRIAREARRPELPALLSDSLVRANAGAIAHRAVPLGLVGAPIVSDEWADVLAEHAERFFPGGAWGVIDGAGRVELHAPGLAPLNQRSVPTRRRHAQAPSRSDAFSDLGQWMAKVLLAPALPARYLTAPRIPVSGPRALAIEAGVSPPTASRFLRRLRELGYLEEEGSHRIVRIDEFLTEWKRANRLAGHERPCLWLLRPVHSHDHLTSQLRRRGSAGSPSRACLGLFAATELLGQGFVRGAPAHLYLEDPSDAELDRLGLVPSGPGERVDVYVREPAFPEAVFRGAVNVDGVLVTDILQCWLDVADHPVRGAEQADHLWKRVIAPHLLQGAER